MCDGTGGGKPGIRRFQIGGNSEFKTGGLCRDFQDMVAGVLGNPFSRLGWLVSISSPETSLTDVMPATGPTIHLVALKC